MTEKKKLDRHSSTKDAENGERNLEKYISADLEDDEVSQSQQHTSTDDGGEVGQLDPHIFSDEQDKAGRSETHAYTNDEDDVDRKLEKQASIVSMKDEARMLARITSTVLEDN